MLIIFFYYCIKGILAKADPPLACQQIKDPSQVLIDHPVYGNSTVNTFVLIQRGNCSFVEKVRNDLFSFINLL